MKFPALLKLSSSCLLGALSLSCSLLAQETSEALKASALLSPTKGSSVHGIVTFQAVADGVLIVADVYGLQPGKHGFHVHEKGDCSAEDASSAGGHFNPTSKPHGGPDSSERHVGDLGNIVADKAGHAHYERVDKLVKLEGGESIIGKSVIVHAAEDDLKGQPTGNAGGRLACGVIEQAK